MKIAKTLRIFGRVQGVGYREFVRSNALALNLWGWVRNRSDGSVEALLVGDPHMVEEMEQICKLGPPLSSVGEVRSEAIAVPNDLTGFVRKETV